MMNLWVYARDETCVIRKTKIKWQIIRFYVVYCSAAIRCKLRIQQQQRKKKKRFARRHFNWPGQWWWWWLTTIRMDCIWNYELEMMIMWRCCARAICLDSIDKLISTTRDCFRSPFTGNRHNDHHHSPSIPSPHRTFCVKNEIEIDHPERQCRSWSSSQSENVIISSSVSSRFLYESPLIFNSIWQLRWASSRDMRCALWTMWL